MPLRLGRLCSLSGLRLGGTHRCMTGECETRRSGEVRVGRVGKRETSIVLLGLLGLWLRLLVRLGLTLLVLLCLGGVHSGTEADLAVLESEG